MGKRGQIVTFFVVALALALGTLFLLSLIQQPLLAPPLQPNLPGTCSDSEIQALWNSVLTESAPSATTGGIFVTTATNGQCEAYFAWKINSAGKIFILSGVSTANEIFVSAYHAIDKPNLDFGIQNWLKGLNSYNEAAEFIDSEGRIAENIQIGFLGFTLLDFLEDRPSAISSPAQANSTFIEVFKETPDTWNPISPYFKFTKTQNDETSEGYVHITSDYEKYFYHISGPPQTPPTPSACSDNSECPTGQICSNGACIEPAEPTCGDGIINQASEQCDFEDLGGETCVSRGFDSGYPSCNSDCTFNTNECSGDCQADWQPEYTTCTADGQTLYYNDDNNCQSPGSPPSDDGTFFTTCQECNAQGSVSWGACIDGSITQTNIDGCLQETTITQACGANEQNFCSTISNNAKTQIGQLTIAGETVIQTEHESVNVGDFFVVPEGGDLSIYELLSITNTAGFSNDEIAVRNNLTGQGPIIAEADGEGYILSNLGPGTQTYNISYFSTTHIQIDFPETAEGITGTFFCEIPVCIPVFDECPSWDTIVCPASGTRTRTCSDSTQCDGSGTIIQSQTCTPPTCADWQPQNTTCMSDDTFTQFYTDLNTCGDTTGQPANQTFDCDFNDNRVIGEINDIDEHNVDDLEITIDGDDYDPDDDYTSEVTIEIFEDGDKRLEFDWDFDSEPLNLKNIELRKQTSSDDYGYLIVNGLEIEKEIRVDRIANADGVCIEEREISSISSISDDCDNSKEEFISCPGDSNDGDIECSISGDFLVITGLENSGATEYNENYISPTCIESWTYGSWSTCTNGQQTRTATDANDCGTTSSRLPLTQTCTGGTTPTCTPSWDCEDWSSIECPDSGTKTRTCFDQNNCQSSRTETRSCVQSKSSSNTILIIGIVAGIIVVAGLIVLLMAIRKRSARKARESRMRRPTTGPRIVTGRAPPPRRF